MQLHMPGRCISAGVGEKLSAAWTMADGHMRGLAVRDDLQPARAHWPLDVADNTTHGRRCCTAADRHVSPPRPAPKRRPASTLHCPPRSCELLHYIACIPAVLMLPASGARDDSMQWAPATDRRLTTALPTKTSPRMPHGTRSSALLSMPLTAPALSLSTLGCFGPAPHPRRPEPVLFLAR